jgi:hypothetical protein
MGGGVNNCLVTCHPDPDYGTDVKKKTTVQPIFAKSCNFMRFRKARLLKIVSRIRVIDDPAPDTVPVLVAHKSRTRTYPFPFLHLCPGLFPNLDRVFFLFDTVHINSTHTCPIV